MPKITVNDIEFEVPSGYTVLQAAQMVDTEVPVFCYHPKLAIAGNCRMCLVEIEQMPKLVASCAMPIQEGMAIHTNTEKVIKGRQGVLEFLLVNHPLDCPICDQGGECDLQDITMAYGSSASRFGGTKRAVAPKYMGPLIKPFMTRCIHCTRCVRFGIDIAGMPELGAVGRGEDMEITTFLDGAVMSELSGNMVDICPVGALTSKPFQFRGRPWELHKTDSIDVLDAVGSNIRIDSYGMKVLRVLPRLNEDINEEWISDKARYACDGLAMQRLDQPYIRVDGKLVPATWEQALQFTAEKLASVQPGEVGALVGGLADCESVFALKKLCDQLGTPHYDCRLHGEPFDPALGRASYLFNTGIAGIEEADACILIGCNVRSDAAMVHTRLRKRYLTGQLAIAYLGGVLPSGRDLCFGYENLGDDPNVLRDIIAGKHKFAKKLQQAKKPMVILGQGALTSPAAASLYHLGMQIAQAFNMVHDGWNGFNILHADASRVGALELGFVPQADGLSGHEMMAAAAKNKLKVLYLLGVDVLPAAPLKETFIIYQGHHGDQGAQFANVILPGSAYSEKSSLYVNTEGRVQRTQIAVKAPGEAKEDWKIIRALSEHLSTPLSFNTLEQVRAQMIAQHPHFGRQDSRLLETWDIPNLTSRDEKLPAFPAETFHFYQRDVVSRHSPTMARCTQELAGSSAITGRVDHA